MIKVFSGEKGLAILLAVVIGTVVFLSFFFWGIIKVIELFLPLVMVLADLLIIVFVLGFLPAAIIKDLRPSLIFYSSLMSDTLKVATGIMSFIFIVRIFGFWSIFFVLLSSYLVPIAMVASALKGSWPTVTQLALWSCFMYLMKFYSQWLLNLNPRAQGNAHVIDVDAFEAKGK